MPELKLSMMLKFAFATIFFWGLVMAVIAFSAGSSLASNEAMAFVNVPTGVMMMAYAVVVTIVAKVSGDLDANTENTGPISGQSAKRKR